MEKRYIRLIPRLDIKGPNLVKGIRLEGLRVLGDPDVFAKHYYNHGADELFYMDVVASLYERNSLKGMISRVAGNVFIPITVGGGLRHLDDIKAALDSWADKVSLNTAAIRNPNPVVFLENEIMYGQSFDLPDHDDFVLPIGRAKVERAGKDVTITAYSIMVGKALQAAEELWKLGIDAEVINLRSIRPLDIETIAASVKKTNRVVSVEESWPYAGMGSEIAAIVMENCFDDLDAPVVRVCHKDVPLPYAANLENMALPQVEDIVAAVRGVCNK